MLTHSINIYKPQPTTSTHSAVQHQNWPNVQKKGKFEYNTYLSTLPFKKGDYVISQAIDNFERVTIWGLHRVKDIQEIHYMCDYDNYNQPLCLHLESINQQYNFWGAPARWKLAPKELLEKLGITDGTYEDVNTYD